MTINQTAIRSHIITALMHRFDEFDADLKSELIRDFHCRDFDHFISIAISDRDASSDNDDLMNELLSAFQLIDPNFDDDAATLATIKLARMLTDS